MAEVDDGFAAYYAERLWQLMPAVYRRQDTDSLTEAGPLRELLDRIGAQVAVVRRSIDRLWEDQSIETCDDWVIPYIADLLATRLVASLDARGQRLDVAKTIYYRRRKGTVALLEELAADITGWQARVVEFFRRLGRARHALDPEIGFPADSSDPIGNRALRLAEGLVGTWTDTGIGGWADLRNVYGASKVNSAFDEFFHTADFRQGQGQTGWYDIPRLGVFLWRLISFGVDQATPVEFAKCPGYYSFDPTGREIPLFASASRPLGDTWVSPQEWQLPAYITTPLLQSTLEDGEALYAALDPSNSLALLPNSLGVFTLPGSFYELIDASQITTYPEPPGTTHQVMIFPETGSFKALHPPLDGPVSVTYHYGFSSTLGAGPYDRRILGQQPNPTPAPVRHVLGGASALTPQLNTVSPVGTVSIDDSLTYTQVADVTGIVQVTLMARNTSRPVIRLAPPAPDVTEWRFSGNDGSSLVVEGLLVSGGDIVLQGVFDTVTLTCCTFDPGNSGESATPPTVFTQSVDGRDLIPTKLWVEGQVRLLAVDRCIMGPIATRAGGEVEILEINDSILQSIRTSLFGPLAVADLHDPGRLATRLRDGIDPLSLYLQGHLTAPTKALLNAYTGPQPPSAALQQALVQDLNTVLAGPSIYDAQRFALVNLYPATQQLMAENPKGADLLRLNRLLLEEAYPVELADLALALSSGTVELSRCTVLGPAYVHRIEVSESILDDVVVVEDAQDGCVRFSAWPTGSVLPRKYESVEVAPQSPLFGSRAFGRPTYAQLVQNVDNVILSGSPNATIGAGAEDGSEMGAFARQKNAIKERSLLIKYQEYMPLGPVPVVIYVT